MTPQRRKFTRAEPRRALARAPEASETAIAITAGHRTEGDFDRIPVGSRFIAEP
jgi:hypothetical protein